MKKLKSLIVLSLMLMMGGQMMGQTHGALMLGASFPMGNYSNFNSADFALATSGNNAGAAIGFNAGLRWYFNVGVKGLNVMLSVDGMYNGLNATAKEFYKDRQSSLDVFGSDVEITKPCYINVPAMLGVNYTYYFNSNLGIFAEAGAGVDARFTTAYHEKYSILSQKLFSNVKYNIGFGFAWQVGIGLEVAKNLIIGGSYYNLGKAPVTAEKVGDIVLTPLPAEGAYITPSMILARVGFRF